MSTKQGVSQQQRIGDQPWLKRLLIGLAWLLVLAILVVPLLTIFASALSAGVGVFWDNITNQYTLHALSLTLLVAAITVPLNLVFGVMLAWLVTRFDFIGRRLLMTAIDLPFAVSPVVAGLMYLLLYGSNGWLGGWLMQHDIQLMFAWPGLVMVTVFITCPFVAKELIPLMQHQGSSAEEAAVSLGASGWKMFFRVTLPNIKWALIYGVILTNARAVGEFGAVSVVSGNIRGVTNTLPLHVELLYQDYNLVGSFASATFLTALALITLAIKAFLEWQQKLATRVKK